MTAKRFEVQAKEQDGDAWATVYYSDDLDAARRYAAGLLPGGQVEAVRVWDTVTGEVNYELQHD